MQMPVDAKTFIEHQKRLAKEVRELLDADRGNWHAIAEKTEVSHSWMSQFSRGLIPRPTFETLAKVRSYWAPDATKKSVIAAAKEAVKPTKVTHKA